MWRGFTCPYASAAGGERDPSARGRCASAAFADRNANRDINCQPAANRRRQPHRQHTQGNTTAHAVTKQVDLVGVCPAQRAKWVLTLLSENGDEIEHVHGKAGSEWIWAVVRRRIAAEIGMNDEVSGLGERIAVSAGVGHGLIFRRGNVAVEHQRHRKAVAIIGHRNEAVDS